MRSVKDPMLILEIFEWVDHESFEKAQQSPSVLALWGELEKLWEDGGFGIKEFPEASQPWAQFATIGE